MSLAFLLSPHGALSTTSSVRFSTLLSSILVTLLRCDLSPTSTSHCRATYRPAKPSRFDPQGTLDKPTASSIDEFLGGREGRNIKHGWSDAHGANPDGVYALCFQCLLHLRRGFFISPRSLLEGRRDKTAGLSLLESSDGRPGRNDQQRQAQKQKDSYAFISNYTLLPLIVLGVILLLVYVQLLVGHDLIDIVFPITAVTSLLTRTSRKTRSSVTRPHRDLYVLSLFSFLVNTF